MKRNLSTVFRVVLSLSVALATPLRSMAAGGRCEDVFADRSAPQLVDVLTHFDRLDPGQEYMAMWEKRFIRLMLRKSGIEMDGRRLETIQNYEEAVYNLLTRKKKIEFFKDPLRAVTPSIGVKDWVHRQVLTHGLKTFISEKSGEFDTGRLRRLYYHVLKILKNPIFSIVLMNPPKIADRPIPAELMAKIIVDGIEPHMPALEAIYGKGQKFLDGYRVVANTIRIVRLVIAVWLLINLPEEIERQKRQQQEQQAQSIDDLIESLERLDQMLAEQDAQMELQKP